MPVRKEGKREDWLLAFAFFFTFYLIFDLKFNFCFRQTGGGGFDLSIILSASDLFIFPWCMLNKIRSATDRSYCQHSASAISFSWKPTIFLSW